MNKKEKIDEIAMISYTSDNFLKWTEVYLKSLSLTNPDLKIFLHCVNVTKENQDKIKKWNKNTIISNNIIKYDGVQERISGSGPEAMWKIIMHCQVSKAIIDGINSGIAKKYILTDVDMLVTQALPAGLVNLDADIGLCFTKEHTYRDPPQILNGAIFINTTQNRKEIDLFFKKYDTINNKNLVHYVDQTMLYECFKEYKDKINIIDLGFDNFLNFLNEGAIMWSAHRGDKNRNYKIFKDILQSNNIKIESKDNYEK